MEYRRFPPGQSPVSTFEFHEHRERAPHLEQAQHRDRLIMAQGLVYQWLADHWKYWYDARLTDLGCGDGGLLSLLKGTPKLDVWGYDFQPSNREGWFQRGVRATPKHFVEEWDTVRWSNIYVLTEVLEHLEDPHGMLRNVRDRNAAVVCSSPWMEYEGNIDGCHAWAWDMPGYVEMLEGAGFRVMRSERVTWSQVHLAVPA